MTDAIDGGFITIYRKFENWEWYTDLPVKVLFLHLLLKANHKDQNWRGISIKRGQRLTSVSHLANETGLTPKQVRLSLEKLEKTGEVGKQTTSRNTLIEIKNYNHYQQEGKQKGKVGARSGQGRGKVGATNNNVNNEENENNEKQLKTTKSVNEETFEFFWKLYPKKKGKPKAFSYWKKLKIDEKLFREIVGALNFQMNSADWQKENGKYIPYPQKWINEQRWLDEEMQPVKFDKPFNFNF